MNSVRHSDGRDNALIIVPCCGPFLQALRRQATAACLSKNSLCCATFTNARRGPSDDCLDIVRETIITVSGVEAGHGQEVSREMVGQIVCAGIVMTAVRHIIDQKGHQVWSVRPGDTVYDAIKMMAETLHPRGQDIGRAGR